MANLRDQLQSTLSGVYTIERELGGGGMSRVFLADEIRLGRKVVVKVLSPDLAAGISAERFEREIKLAASLQQANIVPLLSVGETHGLPWYTMPFVEGESLRARLAQSPQIGVTDVVRILGDVARALQYAHDRGIVHRDIKPDNVLLSGGTAVVTDFGIAKALSASRTESGATLTQMGTSIGTPAYMAPEQAAGDPDVDHRADIYAFGCMAYELLAQHPPFHGRTPQRTLAAHMSEMPHPLGELRPDVPRSLVALIMHCLEKDPEARPQRAADVLAALDAVSSASGATSAVSHRPATTGRALLIYAACAVGVAVVARVATTVIGLPDWVLPGAIVLMALGLPVILFTGYVQSVARHTPTSTPGGGGRPHDTMATLALKVRPHVSWWRAARGGVYVFGGFVVLIAAFMIMRSLGIGPVGSLFAKGAMKADDVILVDDFSSPGDSTLGRTIAQGVKADLSQSRAVQLLSDASVHDVLTRMQRRDDRLTLAVAREVAVRAGAKVIVDGSVAPLGAGFIVTLRLVTADSGRELASDRASVNSPGELIGAVGSMTRKLRGRIGESLRDVQASPRLAEVTTPSLDALRRYTAARQEFGRGGDFSKVMQFGYEAIQLDSTFASAYSLLAVSLNNRGGRDAEASRLVSRAYELRSRLSIRDQHAIEAAYFRFGPLAVRDSAKSIAATNATVADPSDHGRGLHNLAVNFFWSGKIAQAESVFRLALVRDTSVVNPIHALVSVATGEGKAAEAATLLTIYRRRFPGSAAGVILAASLADHRGAVDSARVMLRGALAKTDDPFARGDLAGALASIEGEGGAVRDFDAATAVSADARSTRGVATARMDAVLSRASFYALVVGDRARAQHLLDSAAAETSLEGLDLVERPYAVATSAYARAGNVPAARRLLARVERQIPENDLRDAYLLHVARADVAIAERRWEDAIREARLARTGRCLDCGQLPLALAYDGRGDRDSAIAAFERTRVKIAPNEKQGPVLRRLGELYEARGDLRSAIDRFQKFVTLWKRADPELQPQVAEIRKRIVSLQAREARAR